MLWTHSGQQVLQDWQESLDYSLEAGGKPLWDFGISERVLDGLENLVLLGNFTDPPLLTLNPPSVSAGGNSPLWLLILYPEWLSQSFATNTKQSTDATDRSNLGYTSTKESDRSDIGVDPIFSLVDVASHMASLTINSDPTPNMLRRSPKKQMTGLPMAFRALTLPQIEPTASAAWQASPIAMSQAIQHPSNGYLAASTTQTQESHTGLLDGQSADESISWDQPPPARRMTADLSKAVESTARLEQNHSLVAAAAMVVCLLLLITAFFG